MIGTGYKIPSITENMKTIKFTIDIFQRHFLEHTLLMYGGTVLSNWSYYEYKSLFIIKCKAGDIKNTEKSMRQRMKLISESN